MEDLISTAVHTIGDRECGLYVTNNDTIFSSIKCNRVSKLYHVVELDKSETLELYKALRLQLEEV